MKKLTYWNVHASQGRWDMLPYLTDFILSQDDFDDGATQVSLKSTISSHLDLLHAKFVHYFPAENMAQLEQHV